MGINWFESPGRCNKVRANFYRYTSGVFKILLTSSIVLLRNEITFRIFWVLIC